MHATWIYAVVGFNKGFAAIFPVKKSWRVEDSRAAMGIKISPVLLVISLHEVKMEDNNAEVDEKCGCRWEMLLSMRLLPTLNWNEMTYAGT